MTPGITKQICDKHSDDNNDDESVSYDLDNRTKQFDIGFPIYKVVVNREYKRKIIGYDSQHRLYQVRYEDGDKEEFYHNKIHAHRNRTMPQKPTSYNNNKSSTKSSSIMQVKKKKDI